MADGPLFIVDNDSNGRNGRDYLRDWTEYAAAFDIASGFFEIGALLDLDGHWQKLDRVRVLMGDEISHRTKKALFEAVRTRAGAKLDESLDAEKGPNPFLDGVAAVQEALRDGRIQCRVYNRDKFHAKTYITHARSEVIGSSALVGSSNFTRPGLTQNVELNIRIDSRPEVAQLQEWYERHWSDAIDVSDDVLRTVERHAREFSPFEVYAQALRTLFADRIPSATEWDEHHSRVFPLLDRYQQEAYWALVNIARQHGGAFLCDGVGLGKTFVGLMLIERLVLHENKRVVLFAPKAVKDSVWVPELRRHLTHIGGVDGSSDFSNLSVFSHTDLSRPGEFPERFARIAELADAVIVDEAHHFRNRGRRGDSAEPDERSRYYRLYDLIGQGRHKSVFLLTATPINNSLNDFRHLVQLFSRDDDAHFARTLGVTSLTGRLNAITKGLAARVGDTPVEGQLAMEASDALTADELFTGLVVQRSRAYARASQMQQTGDSAAFPTREDPKVAEYSIRKSYGRLLDLIDTAFRKQKPLFALPMYYPLAYYTGPDESIDPREQNRQAQVVALIRVNFLKRFESSVYAFERSCDRLLRRLLAFVAANAETDGERGRLDRWIDQHAELLDETRKRQLELWGDEPEDEDEDVVPPELLERATRLPRDEYDVPEILADTYLDLDQIASLLDETRRFSAANDDKLRALIRLLDSKEVKGRKVLVFTEFADTARYLRRELVAKGIDGLAQIDSGSKVDRADVIRRFSPYYNGLTSGELVENGRDEIQVLIATDVLSEGLNLQDATRMVNYDIHWNPVRLMQRIGRVDRRLNPVVEERLIADHPEQAAHRGSVAFWNFLPPDELDALLSLYGRVSKKTLLISRTLGIEGRKLLRPEDDFEALKEFNREYEGETSVEEELHLEYQRLLAQHPGLEDALAGLPSGIFSGRERATPGAAGVFFCYRLPALDVETGEFSLEAGVSRWYLCPFDDGEPVEEASAIATAIRSKPETERCVAVDRPLLVGVRDRLLAHIRNTYLKQLDAPVGGPRPSLVCWMELSPAP